MGSRIEISSLVDRNASAVQASDAVDGDDVAGKHGSPLLPNFASTTSEIANIEIDDTAIAVATGTWTADDDDESIMKESFVVPQLFE